MDAYIYEADLYCSDCAEDIIRDLTIQGKKPTNPNENYYDSDDFPKGPYSDGGGESDTPCHCAECGEFLENDLTTEGIRYVIESVVDKIKHENGCLETVESWADFYSISLHDVFEYLHELKMKK